MFVWLNSLWITIKGRYDHSKQNKQIVQKVQNQEWFHIIHGQNCRAKVSKSGRHADPRLRKIFHKILAFERKTVKITNYQLIFFQSVIHSDQTKISLSSSLSRLTLNPRH